MGLFGTKKSDAKAETPAVTQAAPAALKRAMPHDVASVLIKPRITEKAALLLEKNVYTFEVRKGATKYDVRDAVKALYKVTPKKITMVNQEPRHYMSKMRGRRMMESGLRKAYVYLKEGDRIDLV